MSYFERVSPTYLENWPAELKRLSFAQVDIPLTISEAKSLGSNISELFEMFDPPPGQDISGIRHRLDEALEKFPKGGFVRLGSRSAKDAWHAPVHVTTGAEAIERLCDCSERISDDLLLAVIANYQPHIFVREWVTIPEWSEFRCFMRGRKLAGISQYNYLHGEHFPEIEEQHNLIAWMIGEWFPIFRDASHLDDVVFDVYIKQRQKTNEVESEIKLIEINPYFEMTDPCLFDWSNPDIFDGRMIWNPKQEAE